MFLVRYKVVCDWGSAIATREVVDALEIHILNIVLVHSYEKIYLLSVVLKNQTYSYPSK